MSDQDWPAGARHADVEAELATILEGIGEGFYSVDQHWIVRRFNDEAARHFGRAPQEVVGRVLWDVFPGARDTPLGQLFLATMAGRQAVKSETPSVVIRDRWLAYRLFPLGNGIGVVFRDITDRKRAEEQRDLLVRELNHRVNNLLATVRTIAIQTFAASGDGTQALKAFEARLLNLSHVHSALAQDSFTSAELRDLILASLQPYLEPLAEHFAIAGPAIRVGAKSAVALSMAFHELSTNAAKYGALSVPRGKVDISWNVENDRFTCCWQERDGPPVSPPTRTGFGSVLIRRVLALQLKGDVVIDYCPQGLRCVIGASLADVLDQEMASGTD